MPTGETRELLVPSKADGVDQDLGEKRVVVQHLLEVRHPPLAIGGVAMEAPADVIVESTFDHVVKSFDEQATRVSVSVDGARMEKEEVGR